MADKNQRDAINTFLYHSFLVRADISSPFLGWSAFSDVGRSDLVCIKNFRPYFVEIKYGRDNWRVSPVVKGETEHSGWKISQRQWAQAVVSGGYGAYYLYLTVGSAPPNYNPVKYNIKRTFLIPYGYLKDIVAQIESFGIKSLPYKTGKGQRRIIQDNNWGCVDLFKEYELLYVPKKEASYIDLLGNKKYFNKGVWVIPKSHDIWNFY